jgi:hypothetical protein
LPRSAFSSQKGFNQFRKEHSELNYLYYIHYVRSIISEERNGIESFVVECLRSDDVSWLPIGQSLDLAETISQENGEVVTDASGTTEMKHFANLLSEMQADLRDMKRGVGSLTSDIQALQKQQQGNTIVVD